MGSMVWVFDWVFRKVLVSKCHGCQCHGIHSFGWSSMTCNKLVFDFFLKFNSFLINFQLSVGSFPIDF